MRFVPVVFVLWLASCGGHDPTMLAVYSGGTVALRDLDAFIKTLPESERVLPGVVNRDSWLENHLKNIALARVLKEDPEVRSKLRGPEAENRRTWLTVFQLAQAVRAQSLASLEPADDAWISERLAAMRAQNDQIVFYSFRHIFLRKDSRRKRETLAEVKRFAEELAAQAAAGKDFAELARAHSQSADAANGGLVENNLKRDLDPGLYRILNALPENGVSEVVETRTGFHIFKMERKVSPELDEENALVRIRREWAADRQSRVVAALLDASRARYPISEAEDSLATESWSLKMDFLAAMFPDTTPENLREWALRSLVLAEEGKARGLLTGPMEGQVNRTVEAEILAEAFSGRLRVFLDALEPERFRTLYDAGPSGFGEPERAHLALIFVPKGRDSFATQQELEREVEALRAGGSFADMARKLSVGPNAESGGDLGELPPREWSRLHPEIYKTVLNMEPGTISDPVFCTDKVLSADERLLKGGFAILKVVSKSGPRPLPFEEVVDRVREAYFQKNRQALEIELQRQLLAQAGFRILRLPDPAELAP